MPPSAVAGLLDELRREAALLDGDVPVFGGMSLRTFRRPLVALRHE
jgi:hypothetical protein